MANPVDYICTDCNSSDAVVWDAYASWDTDITEIEISLGGENYNISHKIDYSSVELKDLQQTAFTDNALEDL